MKTDDFIVFRLLIEAVYLKAFAEKLSDLPHGKAQTLSWYIYEKTGRMLSYKSLGNYIRAVLDGESGGINPSVTTRSILIQFLHEPAADTKIPDPIRWYNFKKDYRLLAGGAHES